MRVSFHATVRDAAGIPEADMDADDIAGLLLAIREKFGDRLYSLLARNSELREDVVILVNGQNINHSGGMKTRLRPEDDVAIFPPVSGG